MCHRAASAPEHRIRSVHALMCDTLTRRTPTRWPVALGLALLLAACADPTPPAPDAAAPSQPTVPPAVDSVTYLDPPAGAGALAPNLSAAPDPSSDAVTLTWLEPSDGGSGNRGHRLQTATLDGEIWSTATTIAASDSFFANWADLPQAAQAIEGTTFAHWLEKLGEDTYAYGVQLARSRNDGATWEPIGLLHDDASPTEHGFVSYAALPDGEVQAFWLDGRAMPTGGGMHLRTTRLGEEGPGASTLLDDRTCECCATDAALTTEGPVVVYRDRSPSEIRDIAVIRATDTGWSKPVLIHDDGWEINGCPVNGPAIAADGDHVAVAWFTAANGLAVVQVAHSTDGGATFGDPILVEGSQPIGRVDVVIAGPGSAIVSWMGSAINGAEIRWRRISSNGEAFPIQVVAPTTASRSAGVPRMVRRGDTLLFAWVEDGTPARLRAASVPLS